MWSGFAGDLKKYYKTSISISLNHPKFKIERLERVPYRKVTTIPLSNLLFLSHGHPPHGHMLTSTMSLRVCISGQSSFRYGVIDGPRTHITWKTCSEKKIPMGTMGARTRRARKVRRTGGGRAEKRVRRREKNEEGDDEDDELAEAEEGAEEDSGMGEEERSGLDERALASSGEMTRGFRSAGVLVEDRCGAMAEGGWDGNRWW